MGIQTKRIRNCLLLMAFASCSESQEIDFKSADFFSHVSETNIDITKTLLYRYELGQLMASGIPENEASEMLQLRFVHLLGQHLIDVAVVNAEETSQDHREVEMLIQQVDYCSNPFRSIPVCVEVLRTTDREEIASILWTVWLDKDSSSEFMEYAKNNEIENLGYVIKKQMDSWRKSVNQYPSEIFRLGYLPQPISLRRTSHGKFSGKSLSIYPAPNVKESKTPIVIPSPQLQQTKMPPVWAIIQGPSSASVFDNHAFALRKIRYIRNVSDLDYSLSQAFQEPFPFIDVKGSNDVEMKFFPFTFNEPGTTFRYFYEPFFWALNQKNSVMFNTQGIGQLSTYPVSQNPDRIDRSANQELLKAAKNCALFLLDRWHLGAGGEVQATKHLNQIQTWTGPSR